MIEVTPLPPRDSLPYRDTLRRLPAPKGVREQAAALLEQVREGGDAAVSALTLRFDGVRLHRTLVPEEDVAAAASQVPAELREALRTAAANLIRVHQSQRFSEEAAAVAPGVRVWREWRPLARVGVYVPGGRAPYPSSVLMLCIPARLAGCSEVVLCTPPGADGKVHPSVLAAAAVGGATEVHAVGGVQAVAAMTYGTESIRPVAKIFGPGNAHVTAAKQLVYGEVGVDMPAGPSEVVVVTDGSVPAARLTADLEAQAEHAGDALGVLVSTDAGVAREVAARADPARSGQLRIFTASDLEEGLQFANDFSPEHLILACAHPRTVLSRVRSAGSVFLGPSAPAAAGDYVSGANHVIPTGGMARCFSALGLEAFGHTVQAQWISAAGLALLAPAARHLSAVEGFERHWESIKVRLGDVDSEVGAVPEPRSSVQTMRPYQWESSSAEVAQRAGVRPEEVIRFDTNTCPWTLGEGGTGGDPLNEYPDPTYSGLTRAIAGYSGVPGETVTVGAGADELLSLLARAYLGHGDPAVLQAPSYSMFRTVAEAEGASVVAVPAADLDRLREATLRARLTFLCNPNNPTGELLSPDLIAGLARRAAGVVVVDEAYFEFSGCTCVPLALELPNLVVVRTLSKAFGLAGARVGYAISGPAVSGALARLRPPASVSAHSAALGARALGEAARMAKLVGELQGWKRELELGAWKLGFRVRTTPANFLLIAAPRGLPQALERDALVVRTLESGSGLSDWMRVTVRRPEENRRLLEGLRRWVAANGG